MKALISTPDLYMKTPIYGPYAPCKKNPVKPQLKMEEFAALIAEIANLKNETVAFVKNEIASFLSSENSAK